MWVHQDMQPRQGWEPAWSRLSLEAPLLPLLEAPCPSRVAEQGSDTATSLRHGPSLHPAMSKPAHGPQQSLASNTATVANTPWLSPRCCLGGPQALSGGAVPPASPSHSVLTVLAVHPIIPRRALADVVSEDIPPVWDQLALTVVVARIGVAGTWGRGKGGKWL